jgi:DNA adenine methylase
MAEINPSHAYRIRSGKREAGPFLKWAGGKRQLLGKYLTLFPVGLRRGQIHRYVEPFIGSGALFFHIAQNFHLQVRVLSDINPELILVYRTVQTAVEALVETLADIQSHYFTLGEKERRDYYYEARDRYNKQRETIDYDHISQLWVDRSALFLFLNRTCYNGLFRLNSHGEFNVPFGRYKKPRLLDAHNLHAVSQLLQDVHIQFGDFESIESWIGSDTFVYFDPPYRPISDTARFTSYSIGGFSDQEQLRLANFYRRLDARGAKLMLSNSDPRNDEIQDDFFERAYAGFRIERLQANRNISSKADKRGPVSEILILNY